LLASFEEERQFRDRSSSTLASAKLGFIEISMNSLPFEKLAKVAYRILDYRQ